MVFIWRGFGIAVPIVFFLSAWITSYWFEDTRLLNSAFIGWSMLWAGITLVFFALASFGSTVDEDGNATGEKAYNDFFWIPIWMWCLGFIGGSIYLINTADPSPVSRDEEISQVIVDNESEIAEIEVAERRLYLYNCAADSIQIKITESDNSGQTNYDFYVQNNDYEFVSIDPNRYTVQMNDYTQKINLKPSNKQNENDYDASWLVLCAEVDLVLVDVTKVCEENVKEGDVNSINWENNVVERYNGDDLIEPNLRSKNGETIKVIAPGYYIPQTHAKDERVYAMINIERSDEVNESLLRKKIVKIAVRD